MGYVDLAVFSDLLAALENVTGIIVTITFALDDATADDATLKYGTGLLEHFQCRQGGQFQAALQGIGAMVVASWDCKKLWKSKEISVGCDDFFVSLGDV